MGQLWLARSVQHSPRIATSRRMARAVRGDQGWHIGDGEGHLGERGIAGDSLVKSERRHPLPPDRSSISPQNP